MSVTVLPRDMTDGAAEEVFRRANRAAHQSAPNLAYAEQGMRAARAHDPVLVKGMEALAERMDALAESQHGQFRRDASTAYAWRLEPSQVKMAKEAYRLLDEGKPSEHFAFLYAAMAEFQGLIMGSW